MTKLIALIPITSVLTLVVGHALGVAAEIVVAVACVVCACLLARATVIDRRNHHEDRWPPE